MKKIFHFVIKCFWGECVERARPDPAELLVRERREDPVLAEELDDVPGELGGRVDLGGPGRDPLSGQRAHEVTDLALLGRQAVVQHGSSLLSGMSISRHGPLASCAPPPSWPPSSRSSPRSSSSPAGRATAPETLPGAGWRPRRPPRTSDLDELTASRNVSRSRAKTPRLGRGTVAGRGTSRRSAISPNPSPGSTYSRASRRWDLGPPAP